MVDSGRRDLLEYMDVYWKDFKGDDLDLWVHEWNKHGTHPPWLFYSRIHKLTWIGTCISTLETRCYDKYYPQQEVVDYFDKAVEIFAELPSYKVCVINLIKFRLVTKTINIAAVPCRRWNCSFPYENLHFGWNWRCPRKGPRKRRYRQMPRSFFEWNLVPFQCCRYSADGLFCSLLSRSVNFHVYQSIH